MGFWDTIRSWIGGGADVAPDVASFSDARLRTLWKDRAELTDVAREAVRAECERRGLPTGARARSAPNAADASAPRASGNVISVQPGVGVLLQTLPGRHVLVMLPRWSHIEPALPSALALDAIVVCNHEPRGWLDASRWAAAFGVPSDAVHATAPGPIDRTPHARSGEAKTFPAKLALGSLTLARMPSVRDVLRASWHGAPATAAIGPTLPAALVGAKPESRVYIGSLPEPGPGVAWSALFAAANASSFFSAAKSIPGLEDLGRGAGPALQFILVADAVGAPLRSDTHLRAGFGISIVGDEIPVAPSSVDLLAAALVGEAPLVDAALSPVAAEDVIEHLVVEERLDDARRVAERALARFPTDAIALRASALLQAIEGEHDEAVATLGRVSDDAFSDVILASVYGERDPARAEAAARRAIAALPNDPEALVVLSRVLWLGGRVDEARAVIDDAPSFSLTGTRASDAYAALAGERRAITTAAFPHLAERALGAARRSNQATHALRAYRRAVALDPHCEAAREGIASIEAKAS